MPDSAEAGSRRWFEAYLAAFNKGDYVGLGAYYSQDVEFCGQVAHVSGREEVTGFYRTIRRRIDERVELLSFLGSPILCAAEILTTVTPLEDWDDFPTGPLRRGEQRKSVNFAFYDIENGRFRRVRTACHARIA